jgi:ferrous iron transport protein B
MKKTLPDAPSPSERPLRVAIAGNPNSGKSSLFNALTGGRQRVGNYPGVTVEKRDGWYVQAGREVRVRDLPGTYSLASQSAEERLAREDLIHGRHDVVVVVVDTLVLQRGLLLLLQVVQLGARTVLCLNMADEALRAGLRLDLERLGGLLGMPVVTTVAHRGEGIAELRAALEAAAGGTAADPTMAIGGPAAPALAALAAQLAAGGLGDGGHAWLATRLLAGDQAVQDLLLGRGEAGAAAVARATDLRRELERETGHDIGLVVSNGYATVVTSLLRTCVLAGARPDTHATTRRIDRVLAHRAWGLPLFLLVMYAIFWVTFTVGAIPMGWVEAGVGALTETIGGAWPEASAPVLRSLVLDGIIAGVGGVIVFLPNIILLFLGLSFLEDTGYLARAAFLLDRLLHRFGLHGKSFVPLLTGFGCSIPGVMATRTLDNERDRLATMLVLPLMSCGARLPIWMLLIPAFFPPAWHAPVLWLIYFGGVALALLLAWLLRRTLLAGEPTPFVLELPPYRLPTLKAVGQRMWERSAVYLRKAGTVILVISILLWALTVWPRPAEYRVDRELAAGHVYTGEQVAGLRAAEDLRASLAGRIGVALEPVFRPLGFDWRIVTASLGAFAAKEVFVAQMGIVYALGEVDEGSTALRETLRRDYPPLVGVSLILFLLIGTPCMATAAVVRRESGSWKWAAVQFGGLTAIAWLAGFAVHSLGSLVA